MISPPLALAAGLLGLALASAWSLSVGPVDTGLLQALRADSAGTPLADAVLWQLRAPRVALAILAGAVLAVGGCAMQALFRNPLAEPGLLGLSSGAALGAAVAMVLIGGLAGFGSLLVPLCAFGGALAVAALVTAVSRGQGQPRVASMLLAGLAVNAIAGAGLGLLATIADDRALRGVTFWLFGTIDWLWPRIVRRQWHSEALRRWHFWLSSLGVGIMFTDLMIAGLVHGFLQRELNPWTDIVAASVPFWWVRTFSGAMILGGLLCLLYNMWMTTGSPRGYVEEDTLEPVPAGEA